MNEDLQRQLEEETARADEAEEQAKKKAEDDLSEAQAALDERSAELEAREADLIAREEAVGIREKEIEENSFGDGIFQVGVDIQPGRYRTEGTPSGCYWARLASRDDIIDNNFGDGQQIVDILASDTFFESSSCGRWILQ